jgi:hypothetical protein
LGGAFFNNMSIEGKLAYREFLKSEQWQQIRLSILAKEEARCFVCRKQDIGNDIHHLFYRANWADTQRSDCRCLCRKCHEEIHAAMEPHFMDNKTRVELYQCFRRLVIKVRSKLRVQDSGLDELPNAFLREEFKLMRQQRDDLLAEVKRLTALLPT